MMMKPHITFILNPAAGRGKAKHILPLLQDALQHSSLNYSFHITSDVGNARTLAREASTISSIVVAIGGDGTVNEVASGVAGSNAAMAVLSEGSGNDFARIVNAPNNPKDLLTLLENPVLKQYDFGKVVITHSNDTVSEHVFFNSLGIGFDAAVAKKVSSIKWMRGIPLYLTALLNTMIGYKPHLLSIKNNNDQWQRDYFLLCIGNGKWEGGGFMLTPNALPYDGIFEVCGVACNSIIRVLPILPLVMIGKHIGKKYIESFTAQSLVVESKDPFPVHGDGEIFSLLVKRAEITLIPKGLNVVLSNKK